MVANYLRVYLSKYYEIIVASCVGVVNVVLITPLTPFLEEHV